MTSWRSCHMRTREMRDESIGTCCLLGWHYFLHYENTFGGCNKAVRSLEFDLVDWTSMPMLLWSQSLFCGKHAQIWSLFPGFLEFLIWLHRIASNLVIFNMCIHESSPRSFLFYILRTKSTFWYWLHIVGSSKLPRFVCFLFLIYVPYNLYIFFRWRSFTIIILIFMFKLL